MSPGPEPPPESRDTGANAAFLAELPGIASRIERLWKEGSEAMEPSPLRETLHRLTGNAFVLGYDRIGNAARLLESALAAPARPGQRPPAEMLALLLQELRAPAPRLRRHSAKAPDQAVAVPAQSGQAEPMSLQKTRGASLIYLVEDDPDQAKSMVAQLERFGYRVKHFLAPEQLHGAVAKEPPAAILMDIMFPEGDLAGVEGIARLQAEHDHSLLVLFLSVREDMEARLQAVRAGARGYFVKPVDIGDLVDALDRAVVHEPADQPRVLIVDDSAIHARFTAMHLQAAGMLTRQLTGPHQVLETIEDFAPDLLLVDLYMPACTGVELAKAIRQIPAHISLPIVYLSGETDRDEQLRAMGIVGDDFLTKPVLPAHLVSTVRSRIERYRELQSLMQRDSLTGLLNHTSLRERLEHELKQAARSGLPCSVAMLDVDHFKQVNDTHGHVAGDRVLRSMSQLLTRRLRQTDIVGRYGGEEFLVALPRTEADSAGALLDKLRVAFNLIHHLGKEEEEFQVSFSVGVAQFDGGEPMTELIDRADQALYIAKARGRNQLAYADFPR